MDEKHKHLEALNYNVAIIKYKSMERGWFPYGIPNAFASPSTIHTPTLGFNLHVQMYTLIWVRISCVDTMIECQMISCQFYRDLTSDLGNLQIHSSDVDWTYRTMKELLFYSCITDACKMPTPQGISDILHNLQAVYNVPINIVY